MGMGLPLSLGLFAGSVVVLIVFGFAERRTANPILPLWIFTRRVVVAASAVSMLIGAIVLGLTSYVPTFAQGVLGTSATIAGLTVGALTIGWPITASQAGTLYLRFGFRTTALIGSAIAVVGCAALLPIGAQASPWQIAGTCFLIGAGMGLVANPTLIAAQTSAAWSERGVATSATMFARSIGSAVGVAAFGAIVNAQVGGVDRPDPGELAHAIHLVFVTLLVMAVALFAAAVMMPGARTPTGPEHTMD